MRSIGFILAAALLYLGAQAAEPTTASDTIAARAQGCSTCHGPNGEGGNDPYFPRIAGKPAGYLFNQLRNFRDGRRSYPPMNYLLAYLHDDYLEEFADYFAAQTIVEQAPETTVSGAGTPGQHLAMQGDPARGIPACVRCHGLRLTGIAPGIPGLAGLNARYIAAQLVSWRVGTRRASEPDCMHTIASRLSEAEIGQVSTWLAAQPLPSPPTAAAVGAWKTPIVCGSQP